MKHAFLRHSQFVVAKKDSTEITAIFVKTLTNVQVISTIVIRMLNVLILLVAINVFATKATLATVKGAYKAVAQTQIAARATMNSVYRLEKASASVDQVSLMISCRSVLMKMSVK